MSTEIDRLAEKIAECDEKSQQIKEFRSRLESRLVELVGVKEEGSKTTNGIAYKVKTTRGVTRKINEDRLVEFRSSLPRAALKVLRRKHSLDLKAYRELSPKAQEALDEVIDVSLGKVSVKVTRIEEG
jgi:hypothetical protein